MATVTDKSGTVLNSIRVLPDGAMLSSDKANARVVKVSQGVGVGRVRPVTQLSTLAGSTFA